MRKGMALPLFFLLLIQAAKTTAADKYWVFFTDKNGSEFNPQTYFDQGAIDRRNRTGIPLCDSLDFPVNPHYSEIVSSLADSTAYISRWFNGMTVFCTNEELLQIQQLPFVKSIEPIVSVEVHPALAPLPSSAKEDVAGLLDYQTSRLQADVFKNAGYNGKGICIAVFDCGFPYLKRMNSLAHLFNNNLIKATYDFKRKNENVYHGFWHGTAVLSCIAGINNGVPMGLAPGATFLLAKTESAFLETRSEEDAWIAAAEWADKNGADIISSSLGYTVDFYFNKDLNGKSRLSRAATIAAAKGILVVNAAGNEATSAWEKVVVPADADSVLCIGGTDPYTDYHIYFSSYGPTADGRMKPNISAPAHIVAAIDNDLKIVDGTSFSTPLIAGFAACAWQAHRNWSNMELFFELEKSAHLYPYFDYAHGFGIPQAGFFVNHKDTIKEPTFDLVVVNTQAKVVLRDKYAHTGDEKMLGYSPVRNMYFKDESKDGVLKFYEVILAGQNEMMDIDFGDYSPGDILTIHFEGYTTTLTIPETTTDEPH